MKLHKQEILLQKWRASPATFYKLNTNKFKRSKQNHRQQTNCRRQDCSSAKLQIKDAFRSVLNNSIATNEEAPQSISNTNKTFIRVIFTSETNLTKVEHLQFRAKNSKIGLTILRVISDLTQTWSDVNFFTKHNKHWCKFTNFWSDFLSAMLLSSNLLINSTHTATRSSAETCSSVVTHSRLNSNQFYYYNNGTNYNSHLEIFWQKEGSTAVASPGGRWWKQFWKDHP